MTEKLISASIIGGTGYAAGELLRLIFQHPSVELNQIISKSKAGRYIGNAHPNLRDYRIKFAADDELENADVLFLCLPHGVSTENIDTYRKYADVIIDLSADFRLNSPDLYLEWYGSEHQRPELLDQFAYGVVEVTRDQLKSSDLISSAGCNATASILPLYPLIEEGLIDTEQLVIDVKVGSSEGGKNHSAASHHPERSHAVRTYKPTGHRHTAELISTLDLDNIQFTATAVELVRGVLATIHTRGDIGEKDLWKVYRKYYSDEPFIRIVKERSGIHRLPEPKLLWGTNYCEIGFEVRNDRVVLISAIDNLVKGAAGQAIQALNVRYDLPEKSGLEHLGLHPI